jgi:hypothetical protein
VRAETPLTGPASLVCVGFRALRSWVLRSGYVPPLPGSYRAANSTHETARLPGERG